MQTNKKNKNIICIIQSFLILILVVLVIFMMIQISRLLSIEYNAISGRLIIINGNRQILCQRDDPKFDIFKLFEVSSEDIQHIRALLDRTSIQNTEISLQLMAKVENKRQMYDLKLHTLWSPLKKDGYIGIVGYLS